MITRSLLLAAGFAALIPAMPATAQMSLRDHAIERCEDEVVASLDRTARFRDVGFTRAPQADRLSRDDVEVRGEGFYEPDRGSEERVTFSYDCRYDDRREHAMVRVHRRAAYAAAAPRPTWRARVGSAPLPPIVRPAAPQLPPPPEPVEAAKGDPEAAAAAEAASESVAGEAPLGEAVIAAIGDSKGSRDQDVETDQGLKPYEPEDGVTCYPSQRACYAKDSGYDAGWTDREFGKDADAELEAEEEEGTQ